MIFCFTFSSYARGINNIKFIAIFNNRNLDTMKIDLSVTKEILQNTEKTKLVISESGISTSDDIRFLHKCGAKGYLIGTAIMKNDDIAQTVRGLVNSI